ncbi:MAG: extracellular solute-binding protein [Oscillospiraceae bacterium]|nr:extracellular solute-binding protein [Oscillospiraceae bacterium]
MKKRISGIALFLLSATLIFSLIGCQSGGGTKESSMSGEDKSALLAAEKGKKLSIMIPGHNSTSDDPEIWQNPVIKSFEEKYSDVTVEFISASWENWKTKVLASASSGEPIDVINDGANNNPMFAMQGVTQPIQKYINMSNPNLHMETMDAVFKYSSDYYVAVAGSSVCVIYYNKNIFENEGTDDPKQLYDEGKWDFDTFVRIAKELTYDNNTGKRWGFCTNYPYVFFGANATSMLKLDNNYKYQLNIEDPNLKKSLEVVQDGWYTSKWQGWEGTPWNSFYNGAAAMIADFQWFEGQLIEAKDYGLSDFEYGVVPMPKGPNNKDGVSPITTAGWAMGNGCDAPYHAGALIDMLIDGQTVNDAEGNKALLQENVALYKELAKKPFCTNSYDSAVEGAFDICQAITEGKSISQSVAEFTPIYKQKIEQANKEIK